MTMDVYDLLMNPAESEDEWLRQYPMLPVESQTCMIGMLVARAMELGVSPEGLELAEDDEGVAKQLWILRERVNDAASRLIPIADANLIVAMLVLRLGGSVEFTQDESDAAKGSRIIGDVDDETDRFVIHVERPIEKDLNG